MSEKCSQELSNKKKILSSEEVNYLIRCFSTRNGPEYLITFVFEDFFLVFMRTKYFISKYRHLVQGLVPFRYARVCEDKNINTMLKKFLLNRDQDVFILEKIEILYLSKEFINETV